MKLVTSFKAWVDSHNLVLILITVYFLISIIKLEHPGVNNDQLMFVNSATLNPDNMFLWKSFHGIPMMVFPYIGALKSYLYMPIFYTFGVNVWSIRLPQIILISISLFLLYKTLQVAFDKKIALLAILFLSLDPSLIAYSRMDNGPTVLEFFLKVLTVYLLFLYLKTKNILHFLSIYPVLALGIFNKINFFWFANALLVSFVIVYGLKFYNSMKHYGRLVPIFFIVIPYYLLLRLFIKLSREVTLSYLQFANEVSVGNILSNLAIFKNNLSELISGNLFFTSIYGYPPTTLGEVFSLIIFIIIFAGLGYFMKHRLQVNIHQYSIFVLITVLITLQILLTKRAVSAWHTLVIYPFLTIMFAAGFVKLYKASSLKFRGLIIAIAGLIIFYQITINAIYIINYSKPTNAIAYSSAIYDLIIFAKSSQTKFICLDVNICNQLLSFNQETNKYFEPFSFLDPHTYALSFVKLADNFNTPDNYLYVAHGDSSSHFPVLKISFLRYLQDSRVDFAKVKEFKNGDSNAFEVYKVGYNLN